MQTKDKISTEEIRWKIASDFARFLPHAFDEEIRKISAGRYDAKIKEAELKIWKDAGIRQKKYAMMLGYHLENAMDVADAFVFNSKAMFGPEMEITAEEEKGDIAKIICNYCPMINLSIETGAETRIVSELCSVFGHSAVQSLNPAYKLIPQKSICNGDAVCEMLIVKK